MNQFADEDIALFETPEAWAQWLLENHRSKPSLWLKIAKKAAPNPSVSYDQALDVALCFGWIDGIKKSLDEHYFLQRFTPRRKGSIWSKRNVEKALQLVDAGKVQAAGLAEIKAAQADGRWEKAYDSAKAMVIPEDFLVALQGNSAAEAYYRTLNKTSLFAIGFRLQTAKTAETRQRRIAAILKLLESGQGL